MTWALATVLLLLAAPFVLWPLIRRPPPGEPLPPEDDEAVRSAR
ncbi:MAG: hypothetical protein WAM30_15375 [Candidatus Dormiibacterota bacterium]